MPSDLLVVNGVIKIALPGSADHIICVVASGTRTSSGIQINLATTGALENVDAGYAAADAALAAAVAAAVGTGGLVALAGGIRNIVEPFNDQLPASRAIIT